MTHAILSDFDNLCGLAVIAMLVTAAIIELVTIFKSQKANG